MSSRNMSLLPRATLHSDSEHLELTPRYQQCHPVVKDAGSRNSPY